MTETTQSTKPKAFSAWPLPENVRQLLVSEVLCTVQACRGLSLPFCTTILNDVCCGYLQVTGEEAEA